MTDAERAVWRRVRAKALGVVIRRQEPIGPYTVDFVSHCRMLVIEIDGGQHAGSATDVVRDAYLNRRGYRVLRFWNNDVGSNLDGVVERIHAALAVPDAGGSRPPG